MAAGDIDAAAPSTSRRDSMDELERASLIDRERQGSKSLGGLAPGREVRCTSGIAAALGQGERL